MGKRLYTKSKIIIPDPFVIRVDHDDPDHNYSDFRRLRQMVQKRILGTWGCAQPITEMIHTGNEVPLQAVHNNPFININIGIDEVEFKVRSYWFFEDVMDATAFRLSIGNRAQHVFMWPDSLLFTIHETTE